jgi:hypothetical protein
MYSSLHALGLYRKYFSHIRDCLNGIVAGSPWSELGFVTEECENLSQSESENGSRNFLGQFTPDESVCVYFNTTNSLPLPGDAIRILS